MHDDDEPEAAAGHAGMGVGAGTHRRVRRLSLARGAQPAHRGGQALRGRRTRPCGPGAGGRARPQGDLPYRRRVQRETGDADAPDRVRRGVAWPLDRCPSPPETSEIGSWNPRPVHPVPTPARTTPTRKLPAVREVCGEFCGELPIARRGAAHSADYWFHLAPQRGPARPDRADHAAPCPRTRPAPSHSLAR